VGSTARRGRFPSDGHNETRLRQSRRRRGPPVKPLKKIRARRIGIRDESNIPVDLVTAIMGILGRDCAFPGEQKASWFDRDSKVQSV
jgi:hypothetical protein